MLKSVSAPQFPVARFTGDMVETLQDCFLQYQDDGVVSVEINTMGLWLINPHNNTRQFLGKALPEDDHCENRLSSSALHTVLQ